MSLEFRALNNSLAAQFDVQHVVEFEAPVDWSSQKESLRPPSVDSEAWDAIWENFLDSVGSTIGEFEALLAENASYLSRHGTYVSDAGRLLAFELKQASNGFLFKTLGHAFDLAVSAPVSRWSLAGRLCSNYPVDTTRAFLDEAGYTVGIFRFGHMTRGTLRCTPEVFFGRSVCSRMGPIYPKTGTRES
jgi:hypothetical protein